MQESVNEAPAAAPVQPVQGTKSSNTMVLVLIIVILVGLLCAVSGALGYMVFTNSNDTKTEETTKETTQEAETNPETTTIETETGPDSCVADRFDDNTYDHGDSYTTLDGCETCECNDGSWDCTVNPSCVIDPTDCTYDGTVYNTGDTFPATDGCNTCSCVDGSVNCTLMLCP